MAVGLSCTSTSTLFVFRYCQLTENWLYRWVLDDLRLGLAANFGMSALCVFLLVAPPGMDFSAERMDPKTVIERMDPVLYQTVKENNLIEYLVGEWREWG